ncbi:UNVERIFIED_CONTAM: hypothetical protein FKN15_044178 [Acipenser sinensis]
MKALKATACTSQPVLTNQQIRTVFFQAPELLALHREFHEGLRERLQQGDPNQGVGDLFQKVVNQLGVYRGFIDNYESAIATVRKCTQTDDRFKTLAENMMSSKDGSNCRTKYTLEALLYKPLDRVTKTTLVLHDLLKHTPEDHPDRPLLQEALRISSSFLSGVNEEVPHKKSAVTISKGTNMMSSKDGSNCRTKYTLEALLYKPLDRVTKTTLVLHDLLKHTPEDHPDRPLLQEALRISSSFLSGVNEEVPHKKSAVTISKGTIRQLVKDGFLVDLSDGTRSLRHVFLFTDLILCAKLKAGRQPQYRFVWYLPLPGLSLIPGPECQLPPDTQCRMDQMKQKAFRLRQEIQLQRIRQLVKDGFLVDLSDGTRSLRHVFLFTDLILCAKLKAGRQPQYRFVWYLPLPGLSLIPGPECQLPPDTQCRMDQMKQKAFRLRQEIQLQRKGSRVLSSRTIDRARKKLQDCELWILSHSPSLPLELHSRCGKSHTVLLSSLYELSEWRDHVERLRGESCERVSPDLLNLTNSCFKLRTTHHPPLYSTLEAHCRVRESYPHPLYTAHCREFSLQVDGAHDLRLLCVQQPGREDSWTEDRVLGKTTVQLDAKTLLNKWKRSVVSLHQIELSLSLKYTEHSLQPPGIPSTQSSEVFNIHIETVAEREGVLVPHIVRFCAEEVERRGLEEVGIYRISGVATEVQALRTAFNTNLRDALVRLKAVDVNAVSGTLKLYLRELPEPLLPPQYFQALAAALVIASHLTSLCSIFRRTVECHKRLYYICQVVSYLSKMLTLCPSPSRVSQNQEVNKMTAQNLATVFGPSLLRPPEESLGDSRLCVDISQEIVVQVQVVLCYLQCINLPAPQIKLQRHSAELEEMTQQEP